MLVFRENENILDSRAEALVNTVNCVGVMGKGIALEFKKKFPDNFEAYRQACRKKEVSPGSMFVYRFASTNPRWIINFPTKLHWRNPSEIVYISQGLEDLMYVIESQGIKHIAIPALGCGNGGLDWNYVKEMIYIAYIGISHDIVCDVYPPFTHREDRPRSCGAFYASSGEQCTLEMDHRGSCQMELSYE